MMQDDGGMKLGLKNQITVKLKLLVLDTWKIY